MRQAELDFDHPSPSAVSSEIAAARDPLSEWRAQRRHELAELSRKLGLPLGRPVEIWLAGGVRLRGPLAIREASLTCAGLTAENAEFEVDGVPFRVRDLESCVAL